MKDNNKTQKRKKSSATDIQIPPVQRTTRPGDDFYKYVNGNWLHHVNIPTYRSSFGVSEEIELQIEKQIQKILDRAYSFSEKGKTPSNKYETMLDVVGRFMLSAMRPSKQVNSIQYLLEGTRSLYCIKTSEDISSHFGIFNRYGIPTLINIGIFERKIPRPENYLVIGPGSLGLPDLSYYNATAPGKSRTLMAYVKLCREVSERLHIQDVSKAIHIESIIAPILHKAQSDSYVDMKGSELLKKYPDLDWNTLFEHYGLEGSSWKEKPIRVYSPRWFRFLQTAMKKWPSQTWSSLFTMEMILHALPCLPPPFDDLHFELFGKVLRGQAQKLPQTQLALNLARLILRIPLSYLYIHDFTEKGLKEEIVDFAETIRKHAIKRVEAMDWMEKNTKEIAKEKIKLMKFSISHQTAFPDIKLPDLITDNFLKNIYLLSEMNTESQIYLFSHSTESVDIWNDPPYTVNAYYYNETNEFILPAGSIKWPFYTEDKNCIGWKYGGLGAIIGHEITHAFDIYGKLYKPSGEKEQWWTRSDNTQYNKKTRELIELFDKGRIFKHPVDGYMTLSENISDLGGLSIALDSLKNEISHFSEAEKRSQLRDFFISYAISWRIKQRPKKAIQSLFLDVHAPAEYRVNFIVSHFDEWYDTFQVVTTDNLYIPPEERVKIF